MKKKSNSKVSEIMIPIPHDLAGLPSIEAEPWFQINPGTDLLIEGPAFDREGNLFVSVCNLGQIVKITPHKKMSTIFNNRDIKVDGSAFHMDGRLFTVCISGEVLVIDPNNNKVSFLYPKYQGKSLTLNDLVFDPKGNMYVTDFTGSVMDPTGGVYRLSSDCTKVEPVLQNMASPNGISLSPEGNILWVSESTRNSVVRIALLEDGITLYPVVGVTHAYYSTGCPGPDSNKVDAKGNLYQCIMGQGRIVVMNACGIPIANVIVRGRDEGKYLKTSNLAFKPGTAEGYITTSGEGGAWIFKFEGFAEGLALFSHQ